MKRVLSQILSADALASGAFLLSLCLAAFLYGAAVMRWEVFPYRYIVEAQEAWDALMAVESEDMPPQFLRFEPEAQAPGPVQQFREHLPDDLILMTGGFFYRMDLCPRFGCLAWVMDRSGQVLHRWEVDPEALFRPEDFAGFDGFPKAQNMHVTGIDLDPSGGLVVTFHGRNVFPYHVGIARLDWQGRILWTRIDRSHHWPQVGTDGNVYVPALRVEQPGSSILGMRIAPDCPMGKVYDEGANIFGRDGRLIKTIWLSEAIRKSDAKALAYTVRDDCDPFHVNGVDLLNRAAAAKIPGAQAGDLLLSLRSSSTLVVLDREDGRIHRIFYGPMVAQHSPQVLSNGDILVFDNLGDGREGSGSRILRLDPATGNATTVFPRPGQADGQDFFADSRGEIGVSRDGKRILVAESPGGRVFEVDMATGALIWRYDEISDLTPYMEANGIESETGFARLYTQGADYIDRETFERLSEGWN